MRTQFITKYKEANMPETHITIKRLPTGELSPEEIDVYTRDDEGVEEVIEAVKKLKEELQ